MFENPKADQNTFFRKYVIFLNRQDCTFSQWLILIL